MRTAPPRIVPRPPPTTALPQPAGIRPAAFLAGLGIALYLLVSDPLLLQWGIPYDVPGGTFLVKLHPGTWAILLALVAVALPNGPIRLIDAIRTRFPALLAYLAVIVGLMAVTIARFGLSGSAFVIDTLLTPGLLLVVLLSLTLEERRALFLLAVLLVTANSMLGIGEALTGRHLIAYTIDGIVIVEPYFRATAFVGHPLRNALVAMTYLIVLPVLAPRHRILTPSAMAILAISLLAFGSRTAFVGAGGAAGLWLVARIGTTTRTLLAGKLQRGLANVLLLLAILAGMAAAVTILIVAFRLGDRIFEGFRLDASARTRLASLGAFELVHWPDIIFGIGPPGIDRVLQYLRVFSHVSDAIESYWILWVLNFGLLGFIPLAATGAWMILELLRRAPLPTWISTILFFLASSTNNGLASKDRTLSLLMVAIVGSSAVAALNKAAKSPRTRPGAAVLAILLALALTPGLARAGEPPLRHGLNLSHWLHYGGRQPVTARDLAMIRAAGFDHVRIPFDPLFLGHPADDPDLADMPRLRRLDRAVALSLKNGLDVIVDFHPDEALRREIERKPAYTDGFLAMWRMLARHYRSVSDRRLAFELMNEPGWYRRKARGWNRTQGAAVAAIRAIAPGRLLLVSAADADTLLDQMKERELYAAPPLRYVFHFYEPYIVTHHGATWGRFAKPPFSQIGALAYPSARVDPATVPIAVGRRMAAARRLVDAYVAEDWNAARITARIDPLAAWAKRHRVRLICTEFGVLRTHMDEKSRMAWLADTRRALERDGIGWTLWDYADIFGIAHVVGASTTLGDGAVIPRDPDHPRRAFDPGLLAALGLGGTR
jgi:endoglucanase